MIKFPNQHEDSSNTINSYLELDVESDSRYNNELQTNAITNENCRNYVGETEPSRNSTPRIIENKECEINMIVLPKSIDSTADSNFDISVLKKSLEFSDINVTDANNSINFSTSLSNNSIEEMIHEILTEDKAISTSVCESIELDTPVTFCDLNEVNNSIVNNNGKLYYSSSQVANVSQNIGINTIF